MTSLDGPGFSITLLKATSEMIEYIDTPTNSLGWSAPSFSPEVWSDEASRVVHDFNESDNEKIPIGSIKCKSTSDL